MDEIFAAEDVLVGLRAPNKRALLDTLARRAGAALGLDPEMIAAALSHREELGSTGVGQGIGLPHARLDAIARPYGILVRLREPIAFDAIDEAPVDLVVLLLLPVDPQSDGSAALADVARRLRDRELAASLRGARDAAKLRALACGWNAP
ncbi:PTS sugar transporter subunit IIA [Methylobacterium komagatae]|uniref:PTS sugar transporter subunit IIA n=1 Tax=Methylobacterium komagatae TaxID=374425 RepID=A0ABW2BEP3_9HYPH